jgi:cytochrome P450 StaP
VSDPPTHGALPQEEALFDPLAPGFSADPHPILRRVREEDPVHRTSRGFWLVTRYDDVLMVLRDRRFGRGRSAETRRRVWGEGPAAKYISLRLSGYNPPDHTRLRSLISKAFTGKRVESMRPHIRAIAEDLLDRVRGASTFNVVESLTHPLPSLVICQMLGVPESDRPRFAPWTDAIARALAPAFKPEWLDQANRAAGEFMDYIGALVLKRRATPADDLLSALIAAEEGGGRLSEEELVATVLFLFTAGHQTTRDLTGNGLIALLQHPEQLRRMRADSALIPEAVEECLRYDSPVMMVPAKCLEKTSLGGKTIAAGDDIFCALSAANRDPARFPEPDRFNLDRADKEHLAFGAGIHYCLGAILARAEAAIIFEVLLRRYPNLDLADERIEWRDSPSFRGPIALHLVARSSGSFSEASR